MIFIGDLNTVRQFFILFFNGLMFMLVGEASVCGFPKEMEESTDSSDVANSSVEAIE